MFMEGVRGIWRGWHFLPRTSMNVLSEGEDAFSECHFLIYVKVLKINYQYVENKSFFDILYYDKSWEK